MYITIFRVRQSISMVSPPPLLLKQWTIILSIVQSVFNIFMLYGSFDVKGYQLRRLPRSRVEMCYATRTMRENYIHIKHDHNAQEHSRRGEEGEEGLMI